MSRAVKLAARLTADLPPSCRIVAMIIAAHVNPRTGEAWPGIRTIAAMGGLNPLTVTRAVTKLEAAGRARVTRSKGKANRYRLAVDGGPSLALIDYPQPRDPGSRGTEHMSARLCDPDRATQGRAEEVVLKKKKAHTYPCWCDDCTAAVEARARR